MRIFKPVLAALSALAGVVGLSASPALADSSSSWDAYFYVPSGSALYEHSAPASGDAIAAFAFDAPPSYVTRLTSSSRSLTGDRAGDVIIATIEVTGLSGTLSYNPAYNTPNGTPTVRLFFSSYSSAAGTPQPPAEAGGSGFPGVVYTQWWWADAAAVSLTQITGNEYQLTAVLSPGSADTPWVWSDWNGQPSGTNSAAFDAAASHIATVGLSFGGGYFFENGVASSDGTGQFQLISFSD